MANGTHHSVSVDIAPAGEDNHEGSMTHIVSVKEGKAQPAVITSSSSLSPPSPSPLADKVSSGDCLHSASADPSYEQLDSYNEPANVLSLPVSYKSAVTSVDDRSYNNVVSGARTLDPAGPLSRIIPHTSPTSPQGHNLHTYQK